MDVGVDVGMVKNDRGVGSDNILMGRLFCRTNLQDRTCCAVVVEKLGSPGNFAKGGQREDISTIQYGMVLRNFSFWKPTEDTGFSKLSG